MDENTMVAEVRYHESVKDRSGVLRTYDVKITKAVSTVGLTPEQQVAKMNAVHSFLHDELHRSVQEQQVRDGLRDNVDHVDAG